MITQQIQMYAAAAIAVGGASAAIAWAMLGAWERQKKKRARRRNSRQREAFVIICCVCGGAIHRSHETMLMLPELTKEKLDEHPNLR